MEHEAGLAPDDLAVWHALSAMHGTVERLLEQRLQHDAGLSLADFEVLRGLASAEGHRLRAGALADVLGWEKSRISHQVRRMADRGLLQKAGCPTDGRGTWVELADAGRDAFASGTCGFVEVLRRHLVEALDVDEKRVLRSAARVVGERGVPQPEHVD
ncbi:MarR family winged helix-turn-helix transcriptional regulator [Amnibacterium endophyticum]|uniref:MarR family winged helix-turn-helix transcriptional regulator n=1 Tax=Amnibacterium endophyticum TaxID=2109337 RepID=A0ABW4LEP6_9MICO